MGTDWILACMESSVKNLVLAIDTRLPHYHRLLTALKIDQCPIFHEIKNTFEFLCVFFPKKLLFVVFHPFVTFVTFVTSFDLPVNSQLT